MSAQESAIGVDFAPVETAFASSDETTWTRAASRLPTDVIAYIRDMHASDEPMDTDYVDTLLFGEPNAAAERDLFYVNGASIIRDLYPREMPWNGTHNNIWTPYVTARAVVQGLQPSSKDTFYDLGSGFGRVVLYAGITTTATCKGVEMVNQRVDRAREVETKLGLENVNFIKGKVQDVDLSDGTMFYTWSPFESSTLPKVMKLLRECAEARPITIASRGLSHCYLNEPWLEQIDSKSVLTSAKGLPERRDKLMFFRSLLTEA